MSDNGSFPATFNPDSRSSEDIVDFLRNRFLQDSILPELLDGIPECAMVLNRDNRIIAVNNRLLRDFGLAPVDVIGKLPGEALGCVNAFDDAGRCMNTRTCATCGTLQAILESRDRDERVMAECRITMGKDGISCLDLEITASPLVLADTPVTLCILKDISSEKRRSVLEKVFFHDVLNTAGGIANLAQLLAGNEDLAPEQEAEYKQWMLDLSRRLVDEIQHQRKLQAAENGDLLIKPELVAVRELMRDIQALYANHIVAEGRNLVVREAPDITILSDASLLRRILGNLVKNALEAIRAGETVTLYCEENDETVTFFVHNPGIMPVDVQLQLFHRSFSTKDVSGRGIGTYSVKLFGERYLNGKVDFISREPDGTIFSFTLFRDNAPVLPSSIVS